MILPIPREVTRIGPATLPQILVRPLRHKGAIVDYETVDFVPGVVLERNGKRYQIQANGSQKRIE